MGRSSQNVDCSIRCRNEVNQTVIYVGVGAGRPEREKFTRGRFIIDTQSIGRWSPRGNDRPVVIKQVDGQITRVAVKGCFKRQQTRVFRSTAKPINTID